MRQAAPAPRRLIILSVVAVCLLAAQVAVGATFVRTWGSDGPGDGYFSRPGGVAVDTHGNVYVADTYHHRIQKFDANGAFIAAWGTKGTGHGQFQEPTGIATDPRGYVYVADQGNNRIEKFDLHGTFIRAFGSKGTGDGQLEYPSAVAVDSNGNVLVADTRNHRIELFHGDGHFIKVIGAGVLGAVYGVTTDAAAKCGDCAHHIYVADSTHSRIVEFANDGAEAAIWGTHGGGPGQLNYPIGIAIAPHGHVFVADSQNSRVQVFDLRGNFLSGIGSYGRQHGQFYDPAGLALSLRVGLGAHLHLYVCDRQNYRIQEFNVS